MLKTLTIAELINFKTYLRETTLGLCSSYILDHINQVFLQIKGGAWKSGIEWFYLNQTRKTKLN